MNGRPIDERLLQLTRKPAWRCLRGAQRVCQTTTESALLCAIRKAVLLYSLSYGALTHGDIRRFCAGSTDSSYIRVIATTRYLGSRYSLLRCYSTAVFVISFSSRYRYHISISRFAHYSKCSSYRIFTLCQLTINGVLCIRMRHKNTGRISNSYDRDESFKIFTWFHWHPQPMEVDGQSWVWPIGRYWSLWWSCKNVMSLSYDHRTFTFLTRLTQNPGITHPLPFLLPPPVGTLMFDFMLTAEWNDLSCFDIRYQSERGSV